MTKIVNRKGLSIVGISEVFRIQPQIEGDIRTGADITELCEMAV